jgi:hypothetical protein
MVAGTGGAIGTDGAMGARDAMGGCPSAVLVMVSKRSQLVKHSGHTGPKSGHKSTFLHTVSPWVAHVAVRIAYQRVLLICNSNSRHAHRSMSTPCPLSLLWAGLGGERVRGGWARCLSLRTTKRAESITPWK